MQGYKVLTITSDVSCWEFGTCMTYVKQYFYISEFSWTHLHICLGARMKRELKNILRDPSSQII